MDRIEIVNFIKRAWNDGPPSIEEGEILIDALSHNDGMMNMVMTMGKLNAPDAAWVAGFQMGMKYIQEKSSTKVEDSTTLKGEVK